MQHAVRTTGTTHRRPTEERRQHMLDFLHAFMYRGERCEECGHVWTEKGELHYKSCSCHVSYHSMHHHH